MHGKVDIKNKDDDDAVDYNIYESNKYKESMNLNNCSFIVKKNKKLKKFLLCPAC